MAKLLYDLACKVGEYTRNGETKGRFVRAGKVMQNDDGGKFIILDRTFNPAGVPNPDGRDSVILSMFEPRDKEGGNSDASRAGSDGGSRRSPVQDEQRADDDIPF